MVQSHLIDGQKGLPEVVSDIVNYLIIQLSDISSMSNIWKHLIIYLSDIFGVSGIVNYSIIQKFDISSMSDVLKHLINYLSDVSGVSDIVNYSIIQLFDIASMSDVLNHLNIVCPLNIQSRLAWPVQSIYWIFSVWLGRHVLDMDGILISWHVTIIYIV